MESEGYRVAVDDEDYSTPMFYDELDEEYYKEEENENRQEEKDSYDFPKNWCD